MHSLHFSPKSYSCDEPAGRVERDPFTARYGSSLPRGLREEAAAMQAQGMTMPEIAAHYTPTAKIRLGSWSIAPTRGDLVECRATFAYADRITSLSAVAAGPVGAMTSMLHEMSAPICIITAHQRVTDGEITAFLLCERDDRQEWALGSGSTCDEANINALIAGANRLLG